MLVACEFSATVRDTFRRRGFDAWSCDLLPTEGDPRWHIQGDVLDVLGVTNPRGKSHLHPGYVTKAGSQPIETQNMEHGRWDAMIAHPVCTKLANSGSKHLYIGMKKENGVNAVRWREMREGAAFYRALRDAPIRFKAIENPVMHGHAIREIGRGATQFVHPHWFGDPFFKLTGFELIGLPRLRRTHWMDVPKPGTAEHRAWSKCHRMAPGDDRGQERSRFEPGMAAALAEQWGDFLLSQQREAA